MAKWPDGLDKDLAVRVATELHNDANQLNAKLKDARNHGLQVDVKVANSTGDDFILLETSIPLWKR